jgi:hypothetical protein
MSHDPIVDEIRQVRQKILEDCGGDLEKLLDRLKAAEIQDRGHVVSITTIQQPSRHQRVRQTNS